MTAAQRIEVGFAQKSLDSTANSIENDIRDDLGIQTPLQIRFAESYYLDLELGEQNAREIAQKVIADQLVQKFAINEQLYSGNFYVEVFLLDGVTDNLAIITKEAIEDFLGKKLEGQIRTSKKYYFSGELDEKIIQKIATELLSNEAIEKFETGVLK